MDIQRLRNLTTGLLHTEMKYVYEDVEYITGVKGVMTHQLPRAFRAMQDFLKEHVTDPRFWDDKYDVEHVGEYPIEPMNEDEQETFWKKYMSYPNPLEGKKVVALKITPSE